MKKLKIKCKNCGQNLSYEYENKKDLINVDFVCPICNNNINIKNKNKALYIIIIILILILISVGIGLGFYFYKNFHKSQINDVKISRNQLELNDYIDYKKLTELKNTSKLYPIEEYKLEIYKKLKDNLFNPTSLYINWKLVFYNNDMSEYSGIIEYKGQNKLGGFGDAQISYFCCIKENNQIKVFILNDQNVSDIYEATSYEDFKNKIKYNSIIQITKFREVIKFSEKINFKPSFFNFKFEKNLDRKFVYDNIWFKNDIEWQNLLKNDEYSTEKIYAKYISNFKNTEKEQQKLINDITRYAINHFKNTHKQEPRKFEIEMYKERLIINLNYYYIISKSNIKTKNKILKETENEILHVMRCNDICLMCENKVFKNKNIINFNFKNKFTLLSIATNARSRQIHCDAMEQFNYNNQVYLKNLNVLSKELKKLLEINMQTSIIENKILDTFKKYHIIKVKN